MLLKTHLPQHLYTSKKGDHKDVFVQKILQIDYYNKTNETHTSNKPSNTNFSITIHTSYRRKPYINVMNWYNDDDNTTSDSMLSTPDLPKPTKSYPKKLKKGKCPYHKEHKRNCIDCEGTRTSKHQ